MVFGENLSASLHPSGGSNVTMIRPRSQWWWHAQGGIVVVQQIRRALGCDSYLIDDNRWMMDDGMIRDGIYQSWNMFFLKPGPLFFVFYFLGVEKWLFCGSMKAEVGLVPQDSSTPPRPAAFLRAESLRVAVGMHENPWWSCTLEGQPKRWRVGFLGFGREGCFLAREKGGISMV